MESIQTSLPYLVQYSYLGVYVLIIAFSIIPLSKTLVIVAAGLLAAQGTGNLYLYTLVSMLALVSADSLYYLLGRFSGRRVLNWKLFKGLNEAERMEKARSKFKQSEWMAVFTARFLPFIRSLIFLLAGMNRMTVLRFVSADAISAVLFVPVFIGLGYYLGENLDLLISTVKEGERWLALAVALLLGVYLLWRRRA
ncbi:MAG: DedA family protein [Gammaproteobacteria bacterium]|nr:DedA family protein [Gammaproteobacteria bacterium]